MGYVIVGVLSFVAGVVLTLIFRVRVENKLKAEKAAFLSAANRKKHDRR